MAVETHPNSGFVLISVLLAMSMLGLVAGLLHLELLLMGTLVSESKSQVRSQVLAENGVELARGIVAATDVQELLLGANHQPDCVGEPGWRDPVPLESAWQSELPAAGPDCDDGFPWMLGIVRQGQGLEAADEGWTLLRFSNDPEEPAGSDRNDTLLVRAVGIVPSRLGRVARFSGRNCVTILEARLRRERAFSVDTALTLIGRRASLRLSDPDGVRAAGAAPVDLVEFPDAGLLADVSDTARGLDLEPSAWCRNVTDQRTEDPAFRRILDPGFWSDFEARWARMGREWSRRSGEAGLHLISDGGTLNGDLQGLFLVRGELTLREGCTLVGLVVHLGGGGVRLESGAQITGGLWMAALDPKGPAAASSGIRLELQSGAHLIYDANTVQGAMAYLPPTLRSWRILFPEMTG